MYSWMEDSQNYHKLDEFRRDNQENIIRPRYTRSCDIKQERDNVMYQRQRRMRDAKYILRHREQRLKRKGLVSFSTGECTAADHQQNKSSNICIKTEVTSNSLSLKKSRIVPDVRETEIYGNKKETLADLKISIDDDKGVIVEMFGLPYPIDVDWSSTPEAKSSANRTTNDNKTIVLPSPHSSEVSRHGMVTLKHMTSPAEEISQDDSYHFKSFQKYRRLPRGCRLWEFIRDLLHDPQYNPSVIKWTDKSRGEFRLVKSHDIARMWGEKKNNEGMTYEKLSRAMRYYYKRQILVPVLGKRLIYRFGPTAYGWN